MMLHIHSSIYQVTNAKDINQYVLTFALKKLLTISSEIQ